MEWLNGSYEGFHFEMFSASHIAVLTILSLTVLCTFLYREKLRTKNTRKADLAAAFFLLGLEAAYHGWMVHIGTWKVSHSLPLELCNIASLLTFFLLITGKKAAYEILLFIGLLGASQALLTPYLYFDFPHFRFFHFFFTHMIIFWTPLYFTWVKGYRPTFFSVLKTMIFLNVLLPIALIINNLTNGNYLYLSHKPETASMLDLLGPYPWYILSLEATAFILSVMIWLLFRNRSSAILIEKEFQQYF
ncbi:TIGR02206 family membrane protein [Bacillus aerolatus]|uniref:TIGR02206 family membrane protein n=1 Tax=Bacillus aerolatus TaxID=2653354 RepID=A0A6I1FIM4_9BACI|nr:TIGR02206 family membrane protein [Bacillus aerolatus]KAB7708250.1 TIGR02206 family membrane protein [Bacillus aerolatus]